MLMKTMTTSLALLFSLWLPIGLPAWAESAAPSAVADGPDAMFRLMRADSKGLGWGPLLLGMTPAEIERHLGLKLALIRGHADSPCEEQETTVVVQGRTIRLSFWTRESRLILNSIGVPFLDDLQKCSVRRFALALKRRVPGVTYVPAWDNPGVTEPDDDGPTYALPGTRRMAVGIWCGAEPHIDLYTLECSDAQP